MIDTFTTTLRLLSFGVFVTSASLSVRKWFPNASFDTHPRAPCQPPGWVFGVVWPVLYVFVGAAWALIDGSLRTDFLFSALTLLCCSWLPVYIVWKEYVLSTFILIVCTYLTIAIIAVSENSFKWLLGPFVCWVAFATYLSMYRAHQIFLLSPG